MNRDQAIVYELASSWWYRLMAWRVARFIIAPIWSRGFDRRWARYEAYLQRNRAGNT